MPVIIAYLSLFLLPGPVAYNSKIVMIKL